MLAFGLLTGLVGFAHTRAGRPLLVAIARLGGERCPLGFDQRPTAEQREAALRRFAQANAGTAPAAARPALGFVLGRTTRADVLAWSRARGVTCDEPRAGHDLECVGADVQRVWLDFGVRGTLVSAIGVRRDADAGAISTAFADVTAELAAETGQPARATGDASPAALEAGALTQATAEYRCADYYAVVRATNMGDGYLLTEEYRALPN